MLVYYRQEYGVIRINGKRISGWRTDKSPVDISWDEYLQYRAELKDATYRSDYLSTILDRKVRCSAFTYGELAHLPIKVLREIAKGLGIFSRKRNTANFLRQDIRRALRDASPVSTN